MARQLVKIGGLWKGRMRDGKSTFLSGGFGTGARVYIFPNRQKKEGSKQPDFEMFIASADDRNGEPYGDGEEQS